ncbi:MAG TPA: tetratricopeptide repeat protein [Chitinophagaceae bacterium]|nr:tetratricopeptide repeat protein [Chitinophagaceae bacterium]MCC6634531.1 tetratricopeptide repeat protein [Chitinophagaceae bacterium]HMZ45477.1 tetratricopeptide repeat protein [Chitinophagaceae bacterium]HNE93034.1 tetratricopeptide repeat protein [Chitinophagaceae bacterium]HNM35100.1 tetratricopeptide repeat protein [Chitinophagaceae bacterium]
MNKKQLTLLLSGLVLFSTLFFFGKTVSPKKIKSNTEQHSPDDGHGHTINFSELLIKAKEKINDEKKQYVGMLENSIANSSKEEQIKTYKLLANFWKDTARVFEPYAYYTAEGAKLENSEKSLTFAAQLFIDNLFDEANASMQNWLASNGKVLLEKALAINPNNDSSKIGLGACYMLGNISDNPMQGIIEVKAVADKNPDNLYAQWVLGLGGKKSGQYDKAAERFLFIVQKQPTNLIAMLHLAECYELNNNKAEAIKWYKTVQSVIPNPEAKKELQQRIEQLQK